MNEFEDIEQLLKPQCEFKASDSLKQKVMEKARQESRPSRIVRMWPWLAAACVVGFLIMFLKPPKMVKEQVKEETQLVAKTETKPVLEKTQPKTSSVPLPISVETPKRPKVHKPRNVVKEEPSEEPVQMSEETRMALLLARLDVEEPQMERFDTEEEIRQIRMRGERMICMYEENDK